MEKNFPRYLKYVVSLGVLCLPFSASAASLQTIYDKAVIETFRKGQPLRVDAKVQTDQTTKQLVKNGKMTDTKGDLRLMLRYRKQQDGRQDSEGRLVIEKADSSDPTSALKSVDSPLAVEWKKIDKMTYIRLKSDKLPESVGNLFGGGLQKFVGQWLSIPSEDAGASAQSLASTAVPVSLSVTQSSFTDELSKLQVVGVEKRERRANGDQVLRLKLRMDPSVIAKAERDSLAKLKGVKDSASKRQQVANIKQDAAEQYADAKHLWFAAVVNQTTQTLERLEVQGWTETVKEPSNSTKYRETTKVTAGVSFLRNGDWTVEQPQQSLDLKEVVTALFTEMVAQIQAQTPSVDSSTTASSSAQTPSNESVLLHTYIDAANGFQVQYKDGWTTQAPDTNSVWFFSDTDENGIVPSITVQTSDASSTLSRAGNIERTWQDVRSVLLQSTTEKDGMKQVKATEVSDDIVQTDKGNSVSGSLYRMTRQTEQGMVTDSVVIVPNYGGTKYLVFMFEAPEEPSTELAILRDAVRNSFIVIE